VPEEVSRFMTYVSQCQSAAWAVTSD
jgi:hypothetical protein